MTVAGALAAHDTAVELGLARAWLDWPNDLMVDDAKLAGVLVETRGLDPKAPHYVVGIGMNVRQRSFPAALTTERRVTSFALQGRDVLVADVELRLLEFLARRVEQIDSTPAELEVDFVHATGLANQDVRVVVGDHAEHGRFAGFSFGAGLLLHLAGGREKRLPVEYIRAVERV